MYKIISIGFFLLLFIAKTPEETFGQSETDKSADKFFGRYSNQELWLYVGSFENDQIKGSYFGGQGAFRQSSKRNGRVFVGIEGGYLNYRFNNLDSAFKNGSGEGNGGSLGLSFQILRANNQKLSNTRLSCGGMTENSTNSFLYKGKKYTQVQNHWLGYAELQFDVNRNKNTFNRWVFGMRYQYPLSAKATGTINGRPDSTFSAENKKSFRFWIQPTILSFGGFPSSGWAVTVAGHLGYIHLSQGVTDLYGIGGIVSLYNQYSEVIRIGIIQQFNSKKSSNPQTDLYFSLDLLNIAKPLF